jgi:hypothetical protein
MKLVGPRNDENTVEQDNAGRRSSLSVGLVESAVETPAGYLIGQVSTRQRQNGCEQQIEIGAGVFLRCHVSLALVVRIPSTH